MTNQPSIATPILDRSLSFEEFLDTYPDRNQRCELIDGAVCEMLPTGPHEDIAGFLAAEFSIEIRRQKLPLSVPKSCLVKPRTPQSGYFPDVAILDRDALALEPLWPTASVIQNGETIPLVVEVVSTNWGDDYGRKCVDYEAMGIAEYWTVDFRGLGATRYIGSPKRPTVTIFQLEDGEYRGERFVSGDRLVSGALPELSLSADEIFAIAS
ncbi:MAG: Uma2 family endonuclease [Geitlerinemataceae cyanobacterium]